MRRLVAAILMLASPAMASPAAPCLTVRGGLQLGWSDQPDDGGVAAGIDVGAELGVWWLIAGGTLGLTEYARTNEVPIQASSRAAHLGVSVPVYQRQHGSRIVEVRARAALELGRHAYAADGSDHGFLGPDVTYHGPSQTVGFTGARGGLALTAIGFRDSRFGVVAAIEAMGRRDRNTVDLEWVRESCGGLFSSGCTRTSGTATAGGQELSVLVSLGVVLGR